MNKTPLDDECHLIDDESSKIVAVRDFKTHPSTKGVGTPSETNERLSLKTEDEDEGWIPVTRKSHRRAQPSEDLDVSNVIESLEDLDFYEELTSEDFSQSKRKRRSSTEGKDMKKTIQHLRKRNDKLQGRLRSAGRTKANYKQLKPESDEVLTKVLEKPEPVEGPIGDMIENIASTLSSSVETNEVLLVLTKTFGYLTALSNCDSAQSVMTTTVGVLLTHVTQSHIDMALGLMNRGQLIDQEGTIVQQGLIEFDEDKISTFRDQIKKFQFMTASVDDIPCFNFVRKGLILLVFAGLKPSNLCVDGSALRHVVEGWERVAPGTFGTMQLLDAFLAVTDYVLEAIQVLSRGGSVGDYLFPKSAADRYALCASRMKSFKNGQLEQNFGMTDGQYEVELMTLSAELGKQIREKVVSPAQRSVFVSYKICVDSYLADVRAKVASAQLRPVPYSICFYGAPNTNKTTAVNMAIKTFGACTGVPVDAENQYFWKGAQEFQSGLDHRKSVIQIDDACNKKISPNTPEKLDVADITAIVNNQPLLTNQAELDQKGVIYVVCDLLVMTTNVFHLNALQASNAPRSILRRIRFVEVRVKSRYTHARNVEYDYHKQTYTNGIPDPIHDVRFYDVVEDGRGLNKVNTTDWMCITEFMKIFVRDVFEHRSAQDNYLSRMSRVREAKVCPVCKCVENTPWCKCTIIVDDNGNKVKKSISPGVSLTSDGSIVPLLEADRRDEIRPEMWEALDDLTSRYLLDFRLKWTRWIEEFNLPHVNRWLELLVLKTSLALILSGLKGWRQFKPSWFRKFQTLFLISSSLYVWWFVQNRFYFSVLLVLIFSTWMYLFLLGLASFTRVAVTRQIMRGVAPNMTKDWLVVGATSVAVGYKSLRLISRMYNTTTAPKLIQEGNLVPKTMEEVEERIREPDDWRANLVLSKLPGPKRLSTATHEQVCASVESNILRFKMYDKGIEALRGNVFFLNQNTIILPLHSYRAVEERNLGNNITIVRNEGTNLAQVNTYMVNPTKIKYPDGKDTDFILLTLTKSLPLRDMTDLLPENFFNQSDNCVHTMLSRDIEGKLQERTFMSKYMPKVNNGSSRGITIEGPGSYHNVNIPTRNGDCMGPTIRMTNPCYIGGFHMGGSSTETGTQAVTFTITKSMVDEALSRQPVSVVSEGEEVYIPRGKIRKVELSGAVDSVTISLHKPHERSMCRFIPKSGSLTPPMVDVYGEDESFRHKSFSTVTVSPISKYLEESGMPNKWGPPHFKADRNFAEYFQVGINGAKDVDPFLLQESMNDYLRPLPGVINRVSYPKQKPLTLYQACNGIPGNKFIRQMDETTAGGFGFPGKKSDYMEVTYGEDGRKILTPLKLLSDEVTRISNMLHAGEMVCPIVKNALKDEPTLEPVFNNGKEKVRVFNIMSVAYNIVGRQLFLPVISFLSEFPVESELYQNCNVTTPEWEQIAAHLLDFDSDKVLEGDFSKMDVRLSGQMIRAAGSCMIHVASLLGYDVESIRAMEAFICDAALSFWMFNGLLFSVDGWNTSGNVLTILFNGISNSLLHRLCYINHWRSMYLKPPDPFRNHVHFGSVGDDSLGSTRLHWFNMELLKSYFDGINMKYTTANKTDEIVPFIKAEDATFCKRRFRYEPRVRQRVAPLAIDSVYKSLHCLHKPMLDDISITCQNVDGALRELARHDEETFNYHRSIILEACEKLGILHMVKHATWQYHDWWVEFCKLYYNRPMASIEEEEDSLDYSVSTDECTPECLLDEDYERGCLFPQQNSSKIHLVTNVKIVNFRRWLWILLLTLFALSIDLSAGLVKFKISKLMQEQKNGDQAQTLDFGDAQRTWVSGMETGMDPSMSLAHTNDTNDQFFERPVRIATYDWTPGVNLDVKFNPWRLFFEDPRVVNRLAHFRNLKCELVVKFQINGNPFYFGRLIASYVPLFNSDTSTKFDQPADLVEASQRPHVYLNPTESEGGDIVCPFIWPKNAIKIPTSEWWKMGMMILGTMNGLQHANESTDPLTVNVYAYARNVELDTPTSQVPDTIVPQGDEYTGVLSAPAHTLANWAGKLADAPIIGKYARATQLVASAVGGVAQLFGFSRPRQVDESNVAIVRFTGSLASTNVGDTCQTLALDSKKEITIDPSVTGAGPEDPMALVPLAMRESYLTTFDWNGTSPEDSCIFSCRVRPMLGTVDTNADYVHVIPAAWVAAPFMYWTGSMLYRIQVVCSKFHRGRLRVVWDPDDYDGTKQTVYNMNYSSIVDITETTDLCFKIGWGQEKSYMRVGDLGTVVPGCYANGLLTGTDAFSNGTLSIFVVNRVTSPSVTDPNIKVNVFASACEDFEVACPTKHSSVDNFTPVNNLPVLVPQNNPDPPDPPDPPGPTPSAVEPLTAQPVGLVWEDPASFSTIGATVQSPGSRYGLIFVNTGVEQLEVLAYGGPGGSTQDISFSWVNNGSSAVDIEMTINGVSAVSALAPNIGATTSTTVPNVALAEGRNYIQVTTNISGTIRPHILSVTTSVEVGMIVTRYNPADIYNPATASLINQGGVDEKVEGNIDVDQVIVAPSDVVDGSRATLNMWDGATLNGTTYNNPGAPADDRGYRPLWGLMNGGTTTLNVTSAQQALPSFQARFQHAFFLRKPVVPQGDIVPQSDEEIGAEGVNPSANAPVCEDDAPIQMGPEVLGVGPMNSVFFGEQVASIRQILKRYCCSNNVFVGGSNRYRFQFAHDDTVIQPTILGGNISNQTYYALGVYEWYTSAFVCIRGGYRYKVFPARFDGTTRSLMVHRREYVENSVPTLAAAAGIYKPYIGFSGAAICTPNDQSVLEFEVPYYSNYRFYPGRSKIFESQDDAIEREMFELYWDTTASNNLMIFKSVSEDFSTSFFLCTPIVDVSGTGGV